MTPPPRLVPDRPSDAALALPDDVEDALVEVIAEEFHNWYDGGNLNGAISSAIRKHLKDIADAFARELDAAAPPAALAHPSRAEPAAEVVMWSDGRGHAITPQEKTRSCAGDVAGYTIPLFAHPSRGVVDEAMVERACRAHWDWWDEHGDTDIKQGRVAQMRAALQAAALPAAGTVDGEALARRFHETYERLAPSFGYETRLETRAFDPASANGRLMIAVCSELAALPAVPEGESVTLTVAQIVDLAEFAGVQVVASLDWELDSEITVCTCPPKGVRVEGEESDQDAVAHYTHIAYFDEYPDEGCIGLGPELAAAPAQEAQS